MLRRELPGLAGQSLKQGGRVVDQHNRAFVGIDTSKLRNAVAVAEEGRGGDVRYLGEIDTTLGYLPKYSPDLNPIELAFSKLKAHLRKASEHTIPRPLRRIGRVVTNFSPQECRNFFRHAGYVRT